MPKKRHLTSGSRGPLGAGTAFPPLRGYKSALRPDDKSKRIAMKHHFGDLLDRTSNYWTIVPNRDRYKYSIEGAHAGNPDVTIITITGKDLNWEQVKTFPNLEELTLHEQSKEQLDAICQLSGVKRLRITHARPKNIEFLKNLIFLEELILEYVSGFSDLSPLNSLTKLKSLHLENLRKVSDFSGLSGIQNLKYLSIDGTLDWKQPIESFEFLLGLDELEFFSLGQIITKEPFPALLPLVKLKNLKKIKIPKNMLQTNEYALISEGLPQVDGSGFEAYTRFAFSSMEIPKDDVRAHLSESTIKSLHPEVIIAYDGRRLINDPSSEYFEFIGKGSGRIKCDSKSAEKKCREYVCNFNAMKAEAKKILTEKNL
jgi:hypothetical protein